MINYEQKVSKNKTCKQINFYYALIFSGNSNIVKMIILCTKKVTKMPLNVTIQKYFTFYQSDIFHRMNRKTEFKII